MPRRSGSTLIRFSVSMPASAVEGLDRMTAGRGFANRSQCLTALVRDHLVAYASELGDTVMMGVISLIYDHQKRNLQNTLTDIQHKYLREIVTIQVVHLEDNQSLQIMLVQGPARTLRQIKEEMSALKGVRHGQLQLNTTLLPPLYEAGSTTPPPTTRKVPRPRRAAPVSPAEPT